MKRLAKALILLAVMSAACTKDAEIQEREYPMVRTFLTSDSESITFTGEIFSKGSQEIISYGFVYDTLFGKQVDTILLKGKPEEEYSITLQAGFAPGEIYQLRAFIRTPENYIFGNKIEFGFNGSKPVELYSFTPSRGTTGDTVIIEGKYFSRAIGGNIVRFGNDTAKVILVEEGRLFVTVPEIPEDQICQISVKTPSSFSSLAGQFERWYNWTRLYDSIPGSYHRGTKAGDFFVLFDNWNQTTMAYNISTGSYFTTSPFPGSDYGYYSPVFSCEGLAYMLCNGSKQLWQYNPETDVWIQKQDIPSQIQTDFKPMVFGSVAYFLIDHENLTDIWAYDASADTWTQKAEGLACPHYSDVSIAAGNKGYFCYNTGDYIGVYEFDPVLDTVRYLCEYPGKEIHDLSGFFIDGKIYIGLGYYEFFSRYMFEYLWEFNPQTLEWKESFSFPGHDDYKRFVVNAFSEEGYVIRHKFASQVTEVYKFNPGKR